MPRHPAHLTDVELEFMNILWQLGEGTIADVLSHLAPERKLAYTSVATIVRLLEQKGVLKSRKVGRQHVYTPLLARETFASVVVRGIIANVFEGKGRNLANYLVKSESLSDADLEELERLIAERKEADKT